MRFLLLSCLITVCAAEGLMQCGTAAAKDQTGYFFVSKTSCVCDAATYKTTSKDADDSGGAGAAQEIVWWADDGAEIAAGSAAVCAYDKSPLKTTTPPKDSDGFWDNKNFASYEIKNNYVSTGANSFPAGSATAKAWGSTEPSGANLAKGFMALMEGELIDQTIYDAAKVGIKGSDAAQGDPLAFCSRATRGDFEDLSTANNQEMTAINAANRGRCVAGEVVEVASADELGHNSVGDTTKKCYHLPWKGTAQTATACAASKTCDRFVEGESQCITTTKLMDTTAASRAAAAPNKDHCLIQPNAGGDDKYRHLNDAYSSQVCTAGYFCNPFARLANADPVCLQHVLGNGSVAAQVRADGVLETGSATDHKWCLGVTLGAKRCTTTEVCNPHASTLATLCINKTATSALAGVMDFGAVGAAAPASGTDLRGYCIGDNAVGSICPAQTVCNYAGGNQTGDVAGGEVCLPHTKLLGEIADTAAWTAAAQRKLPGKASKHCLATNGSAYSSKVCEVDTELCNPHAAQPSDVCIKAITVLNHAEIAPLAAVPAADSKTACIGLTLWKQCSSESTDGTKFVCNEGAGVDADVCINTTMCVNEEKPLEGFYVAGVEAADDQKWCFATDGAAKCGLDQMCNPGGEHGGSNAKAICADATKRVPHGTAGDSTSEPALIHCYGKTGNSVLLETDEEGWLCDEGKGVFHDPASRMEGRAAAPPADPNNVIAEICFGDGKVEKCSEGVYCNETGTETGCSGDKCKVENICVTLDSIIDGKDAPWVDQGRSICLNDDATAGENCTSDKMYCDRSTGACVTAAVSTTVDPSDGSGGGGTSGAVARSLAAAAVVAILSA